MGTEEITRIIVQTKLDKELMKEVDHLAVEWELFRNETLERLLRQAIDQLNKEAQV